MFERYQGTLGNGDVVYTDGDGNKHNAKVQAQTSSEPDLYSVYVYPSSGDAPGQVYNVPKFASIGEPNTFADLS